MTTHPKLHDPLLPVQACGHGRLLTRRAYAQGPYGQVHFHEAGSADGVPLVLLHQAPVSARQFEPVYPRLAARGIRAIGIDMPGFGFSDPTPFVPGVEDYAKAIPAVLDALGIERAHILGHHTGALVATEVALQFPGRIERLVLNGPLPLQDAERAQWLEFCRNEEIPFREQPDASHLVKLFGVRYAFAKDSVPVGTVTRYLVETLSGLGPYWYGHHAAFVYDHAATLPRIRHRTLILTNTGDQIFEHAQRARALRPDFEFVALEGGGIDVVDQLPDAWTEAVANYVLAGRFGTA
ncbi:MAG: alpha/beta hydrolase [Steroidobacteraceae bacterium]|jgi:pimeloyl-ACP methyl ester carboxylesterase|nr:alpha/beta hydrolase [Steroidobacteraceae bacterium]